MTQTATAVAALTSLVLFLAVAIVPGVLFFRMPVLRREQRASLPFEERWFWQVLLSIVWSVLMTLALAAMSKYTPMRLAGIAAGVSAIILLVWRTRLRMANAPRPTASALFPIALIALAFWRLLPASEYVIGGKDPGVYINEGVSIHRQGTIFRRDAIVAEIPEAQKDLFFHDYPPTEYWGLRFMGVWLNDPTTGEVIAQFPHLLPASFALGYGIAGIRGATTSIVIWSVLGILAVYFFGVRLVGRLPAAFACLLLLANVIEVWYGRYPNAEVVMQALVFAGVLAFSYSLEDGNRYFGWVAGLLAAALIFLRFDAYLAIAAISGAAAMMWVVERKAVGWGAGLLLAVASVLAWIYYSGPMRGYFWMYRENLPTLENGLLFVGFAVALTLFAGLGRRWISPALKTSLPPVLVVTIFALAAYALFFRAPGGRLTDYDAYGLRTFRSLYAYWPATIAGLAGFAMLVWRRFWKEPAFFLLFSAFSMFFFYKLRVPPEQFWMARRFLPVILPGLLLLAAGGAFGSADADNRRKTWRVLVASAFLVFIGWQFTAAAAPVAAHVEYRGAIRYVERLAERIGNRDLVIFESRESDMHVYALPLAYVYGRSVAVLESPRPDRRKMEALLAWAASRFDRVLFVGSAGTDLLAKGIVSSPVASAQVVVPEYATSPWNDFPAGVRQKDLGYSVYELKLGEEPRQGFVVDVGTLDDLHVLRFQAKETTDGRTVRWTGEQSFVMVTGLTGEERELTMVMHDGGRPAGAPAARVQLFLANSPIGTLDVGNGFRDYHVAIPADLVRSAAASGDPAELKIVTTTWTPRDYLGGTDTRALGVMVDRVEIH